MRRIRKLQSVMQDGCGMIAALQKQQRGTALAGLAAIAGREQLLAVGGRILRVAATVWVAWTLAGLLWLASGHNGARLVPPPAQAARKAPAVDVGQLASYNLFGAAPVAAQAGAAANAPDTTLQLRLAGVFVNADAAQSSAIVAERNNPSAPAKVYRVNDALPGGATLAEVHDDRILLRRGDGASEILRFEKTGLLDGGTPAAVGGAPEQDDAGEGGASGTEIRAMLGNAIQALSAAPDAFIEQMGLKAGPMGYEITEGTPEDLRQAVGLQPGDRILSVNGRRLGNPRQDRDALAGLRASGSARVEVQRGGQIVTIERKF
jgi:general secretion pathway protein C